jgi:hypothetical protein
MTKWIAHQEISLDKEASKKQMMFYAYPEGAPIPTSFFSSTLKSARDAWLKERQ